MFITLIIPHFYTPQRLQNLYPITRTLGPQVNDIIIWNNDKPLTEEQKAPFSSVIGAPVHIIQSSHNLGCQGRFEAVKHVNPLTTHILFHDNDLIERVHSVNRLIEASNKSPNDIISVTGERRFYDGVVYRIGRARYELVPIHIVNRVLQYWQNNEDSVHDDVWFSVMAHHLGHSVQFVNISWRNIDDRVGFWRTKGFFDAREVLFNRLMKEGLPNVAK